MDGAPGEGVKVGGARGEQSLPLPCRHLDHGATVQRDAAGKLDEVVLNAEDSFGGLRVAMEICLARGEWRSECKTYRDKVSGTVAMTRAFRRDHGEVVRVLSGRVCNARRA